MKSSLLLLCLFGLALPAFSQQDSWTITWNGKTKLKAREENETSNIVALRKSELTKSRRLMIVYKEGQIKNIKALRRSLLIYDDKDQEVWKGDSTRTATLNGEKLAALFSGTSMLKIYTIAVPSDPKMAARVRVRRVHLCTLQLQ